MNPVWSGCTSWTEGVNNVCTNQCWISGLLETWIMLDELVWNFMLLCFKTVFFSPSTFVHLLGEFCNDVLMWGWGDNDRMLIFGIAYPLYDVSNNPFMLRVRRPYSVIGFVNFFYFLIYKSIWQDMPLICFNYCLKYCISVDVAEGWLQISGNVFFIPHDVFRYACICTCCGPPAGSGQRAVWKLWWRHREWLYDTTGHRGVHRRAVWKLLEGQPLLPWRGRPGPPRPLCCEFNTAHIHMHTYT